MRKMDEDDFIYIIERAVSNARDALKDRKENEGDLFYQGRTLAYYEIFDTIRNELIVRDQNLDDYGITKEFMSELGENGVDSEGWEDKNGKR